MTTTMRSLILLGAGVAALAAVLVIPEEGQGRRPCRRKYGCYEHLRKTPLYRSRLPRPGEVRGGVLLSARHLPTGPRVGARRGDYFLRSPDLVAVIAKADGAVIDLSPRTGQVFTDRLAWARVRVCQKGKAPRAVARPRFRVEGSLLMGKPRARLHVGGRVGPLEVSTRYAIVAAPAGKGGGGGAASEGGEALELRTELVNRGGKLIKGVGVCDHVGAGNTPLFVAGHGVVDPRLASQQLSAAYAVRSDGPLSHLLLPLEPASMALRLSWGAPRGAFDPAIDASYGHRDLAPGQRVVSRRLLVAARGAPHVALARALTVARRPGRQIRVAPPRGVVPGTRVRVSRAGKPLIETPLTGGKPLLLTVPASGNHAKADALALQLWQPGLGVYGPQQSVPASATKVVKPTLFPMGTLRLEVVEGRGKAARPLPAKVRLISLDKGTPGDLLGSHTSRFGRGGGPRVENVIYTAGRTTVPLPAGRYRAMVSHGFEHDIGGAIFRVRAGRKTRVRVELRRVVPWLVKTDKQRWLRADLHVHGEASHDSPLTAAARVVSAAAVGLDLIVASDHDALTDYRALLRPSPATFGAEPAAVAPARALLASGRLTAVIGSELAPSGAGHFTVFPLARPLTASPLTASPTKLTPAALLAAVNKERKGGSSPLVQVNHPRMGRVGYFDQVGYDPAAGKASGKREGLYREGLVELLEVVSGDDFEHPQRVDRVTEDWLSLLRRGKRVVATGGSASHRLPVQDAGYPRTYVRLADGLPSGAPARQRQLVDALTKARAFVTTGPLVRFSIARKPTGSTFVHDSQKHVPLTARIEVLAAPWVDVSEVELLVGGKVIERFAVRSRRVPRRFARQVSLPPLPKGGTFYIVRVRGKQPDPTQTRRVLPFALTNPIWVKPAR